MIEMIRTSSVPATLMQSAAKGALSVPPQEMIEILVHLAVHNKVFAEKARFTLASWDEGSSRAAAADPQTPKEVLDYFIEPQNLRPALLPTLLENPAIGEESILKLAAGATTEQVDILLASPRACQSRSILSVLHSNANIVENELAAIEAKLAALGESPAPTPTSEASEPDDPESDAAAAAYISQNAAEIAAAGNKAFQPTAPLMEGGLESSARPEPEPVKGMAAAAGVASSTDAHEATAAHHAPQKKWILSADEQRGSALQKINKLDIKGRIQLAMKGNKEERSLLIRDGTKIVALAVLDSPKLTDAEVEKFATQKNVLESVLRAIPMKRRFMKIYPVVRNLCFNPRTPIDVSLGLLKNLLTQDLRHLSGNKEVSETVRKLATKMFRQKLDVTKKD
jgi:hypothetical protein